MCTEKEALTCHCIQFKFNITHTNTVVIPLKRKGEKVVSFQLLLGKSRSVRSRTWTW